MLFVFWGLCTHTFWGSPCETFIWPTFHNKRTSRLWEEEGRGQHEYYILNSGGRHPLQASVWIFNKVGLFTSPHHVLQCGFLLYFFWERAGVSLADIQTGKCFVPGAVFFFVIRDQVWILTQIHSYICIHREKSEKIRGLLPELDLQYRYSLTTRWQHYTSMISLMLDSALSTLVTVSNYICPTCMPKHNTRPVLLCILLPAYTIMQMGYL